MPALVSTIPDFYMEPSMTLCNTVFVVIFSLRFVDANYKRPASLRTGEAQPFVLGDIERQKK
jgi:hypothetical protein